MFLRILDAVQFNAGRVLESDKVLLVEEYSPRDFRYVSLKLNGERLPIDELAKREDLFFDKYIYSGYAQLGMDPNNGRRLSIKNDFSLVYSIKEKTISGRFTRFISKAEYESMNATIERYTELISKESYQAKHIYLSKDGGIYFCLGFEQLTNGLSKTMHFVELKPVYFGGVQSLSRKIIKFEPNGAKKKRLNKDLIYDAGCFTSGETNKLFISCSRLAY